MSNTKQSEFNTFVKGFWEMPKEKPKLVHSFLRGAIFAVILLVIFPPINWLEIVLSVVLVGGAWVTIDIFLWKYIEKKGAK